MSGKVMERIVKIRKNRDISTYLQTKPPTICLENAHYKVYFASTEAEMDAALKLRFEVFNLELGEGLDASFETMRDRDEFDAQCHHLIVESMDSGDVIATYRMQTKKMAAAVNGFYSEGEFQLSQLPAEVLAQSVEVGRACIAKTHRNGRVLFLLWQGIAQYMRHTDKRYLFGCCSLTSQDPFEGKALMDQLILSRQVHSHFCVYPQKGFECYPENFSMSSVAERIKVPRLFRTYLSYGAKVCGPPAIDRAFKTIDYLVLMDVATFDQKTYQMFFR